MGLNPFVYEEPVEPEELVDRRGELEELLKRAREGRNSRLEAPRRFGKTSLLRRLLRDAERQGLVGVYVDFFGILTIHDVSERIERAYREQLPRRLRGWFAGLTRTLRPVVRAGGGPVPASAEFRVTAAREEGLLDRLDVPKRMHAKHGTRSLIVFDEFQEVLRAREGMDAVIRSVIQHHGAAAGYVFSGSHPGMMSELFASRRRAFYGQAALVRLGTLDSEDLAAYIADRFARGERDPGDALGYLLDLAAGHPQRAMMLAYHLFDQTEPRTVADSDTWSRTLLAVGLELRDEFEEAWRRMSEREQRVLSAIADNRAPLYSLASQELHGIKKSGSFRAAISNLAARGDLVAGQTPTRWRVVDPLFAVWVRNGRAWPT